MRFTIYIICVLSFLKAASVQAQNEVLLLLPPDTSILLAHDVVIKENRLQLRLSEISRSIDIINRRQIEQAPVQSVGELLNYFAGVDVRQRGVHGVQPDVTIRGGTFDQTLVLINGIKFTDPQTGHHSLNIPVDIENIERIEIVKGPAARIYGQNALAGAINIVTRQATTPFTSASAQIGDYDLLGLKTAFSIPAKNMQQMVSIAHNQSRGYRPNSDYKISNLFYQNRLSVGNKLVNMMAGITNRDFGASGFYNTVPTSNEREAIQTNFVAAEMPIQKGRFYLAPRVSWRRNQDNYIFDFRNPATRNFTLTQVLSAELNSSYQSNWGVTGLSVEYNHAAYFNARLGNHQRDVWSGFLEHRFSFWQKRIDLTPGVMLAHYSDFGRFAFPGIDFGWRLTDKIKVFANYGQTYRVPTYTDLYFRSAAILPNPNLKPERANAYEVGAKFQQNSFLVQVAYFERDAQNLIDRTRDSLRRSDGSNVPFNTTNQTGLLVKGVEARASYVMNAWKGSRFDVSYLNILNYDLQKVALYSRYALDFLTEQATVSIETPIWGKLRQNTCVRYGKRLQNQADVVKAFTVVDTKWVWREEGWSLFAQASNVLDANYVEQNNIPMPKRWFSIGWNYYMTHR